MKYLENLPPDTRALLEALDPALLSGFLLVGGTGLALQIGHRISEDLDFMSRDRSLPLRQIDKILSCLNEKNYEIQRLALDPEFLLECDRAGDDPEIVQQRYLIGTTKVDFFIADPHAHRMLDDDASRTFRIASIRELFRLKCSLLFKRTASRDIYDLYCLFKDNEFSLPDLEEALSRSTISGPDDYLWTKLCQPQVPRDDPGYEHLVEQPPSLEEIGRFFTAIRLEQIKERGRKIPDA